MTNIGQEFIDAKIQGNNECRPISTQGVRADREWGQMSAERSTISGNVDINNRSICMCINGG